ncbi:MAG: ribonuclease H-like domain-containing protein [Candidatus Omnitrophica bacterium]|nr:ribonuclease H-like domain-containing protein [Candidatus Omnitrophota bacterium]
MKSSNILVLDLETQKSFSEVGKAKLQKLKVSVVGIYDYRCDQYTCYDEKEILTVEKRLQDIDLLIGFNIRRFDLPVLEPYLFTPIASIPVLDLLEEVEQVRGHRASLESIAVPTLKQHKSGSGRDALTLFKENRIEELKRYCLDDVRLTREIYEYGCREGKILFTSTWDYKTYEIPVSWKKATEDLIEKTAAARANNFPASLF